MQHTIMLRQARNKHEALEEFHRCWMTPLPDLAVNTAGRRLTMRCASTGAKASFRLNASAECASLPCSPKNRCRTSSRKAYGSRRPSACSPHAQVVNVCPASGTPAASRC